MKFISKLLTTLSIPTVSFAPACIVSNLNQELKWSSGTVNTDVDFNCYFNSSIRFAQRKHALVWPTVVKAHEEGSGCCLGWKYDSGGSFTIPVSLTFSSSTFEQLKSGTKFDIFSDQVPGKFKSDFSKSTIARYLYDVSSYYMPQWGPDNYDSTTRQNFQTYTDLVEIKKVVSRQAAEAGNAFINEANTALNKTNVYAAAAYWESRGTADSNQSWIAPNLTHAKTYMNADNAYTYNLALLTFDPAVFQIAYKSTSSSDWEMEITKKPNEIAFSFFVFEHLSPGRLANAEAAVPASWCECYWNDVNGIQFKASHASEIHIGAKHTCQSEGHSYQALEGSFSNPLQSIVCKTDKHNPLIE